MKKLLVLCLLPFAKLAAGQSLNYAQTTVEVNAGVVVLPGQTYLGVAANPAPHLWSNLDQDAAIKPAKWTFTNPFAPTVLTSGLRARWSTLDGSTPAVGSRVTKRTSPYWEVPITDSDDTTLSKYDILSLSINQGISLNAAERDKLRRYVDQGGVLWIDVINDPDANLGFDQVNTTPIPFNWTFSSLAIDANVFHPLLSYPNSLSISELPQTDYPVPANRQIVTTPLANGFFGAIEPFQKWMIADSNNYQPVAGTSAGSTISVAKIGQGYVVLTSRGVTANINRGAVPGSQLATSINRGYFALGAPKDSSFLTAARLAYNIISLGGRSTSKDNGSRHMSSNSVDLTPPLLSRFSDTPGGTFGVGQQPALYKGRIIVTQGNQVLVYDARPDRDIDGDGSSDDGVSNTIGTLGDLIWISPPMGGRLSAPTIVESPRTALTDPNRPGFAPTDQVWVTDENSNVYIFDLDADGVTNQGLLAAWPPIHTVNPPNNTGVNGKGPFAPVVHESLVFITDTHSGGAFGNTGRVWAIDLDMAEKATSGTNNWSIQQSSRYGEPSAPATVGYIPIQDGSGGLDRVIYIPTQPNSLSNRPAGMTSIWLGARAESPVRRDYTAGTMVLTTRASYNGLPILLTHPAGPNPNLNSLGLKMSLIKANGDPVSETEVRLIFASASVSEATRGVLQVSGLNPLGYDLDGKQTPGNPNDDVGWRLDYTVDWGQAGSGGFGPNYENYVRGNLDFPDDTRNSREVIGSIALGPNGNIYVVTSFIGGSESGGTYMNFKENQGPGNFTLLSKFDLYEALTFSVNNSLGAADQINMPTVLTDEDQLVTLIPFLNTTMRSWKFTSGPVVRNGTVYVTASSVKPIFTGSPTGVVMAFRADVPPPSFEIEGSDANFTIVQADPTLSLNKTAPEVYSGLQYPRFTIESIPGTTRSRVVINNLMNLTRGRIRDTISSSLPIMIRRSGQTDTLIEPEALSDNGRMIAGRARNRWNPLLWYIVFNGYRPGAGPVVCGQTLYQGGASILPSLISGGGFNFKGLLFAMDSNISPNDEFLVSNSVRPWTLQLNTFLGTSFNNVRPANALKWPQFKGIQDIDDLRIRILQATVPESGISNLAGGDESLAATGPQSLYAYSRSDFLVIDSGRVGRFDPAGNPLWITDQTEQSGRSGPSTNQGTPRQLSEPNRIYPTGDNGYWIVDTGNNRVVRVDGSGREIRSLESMRIDPQFKPDGVTDQGGAAGLITAENAKLRRPKDVLVFETLVDGTIPGANPFSNPRPLERWIHMLVADSGNSRVVELIDRYEVNPATGRTVGIVQYQDPPASGNLVYGLGVLYWHTPEELTGKGYSYNSIARTVQLVGTQRHNIVALGFGNVEPGTASLGLDPTNQDVDRASGFGGVVLYDGPNSIVIREFQRPVILQNSFLGENPPGSGSFNYNLPIADQPTRIQKLVGIRSVSVRYVDWQGGLKLSVMVTDNTGVYELVQDTTQATKPWVVRWMLPVEAYVGMRHPRGATPYNLLGMSQNPARFRPTYASRLDSGEVLIVNGYSGQKLDGSQFQGEVILVDGTFADAATQVEDPGYSLNRANLGFNRLSVKFELPPVTGVRGIVSPVFAIRQ